jgi:hypothetical protein
MRPVADDEGRCIPRFYTHGVREFLERTGPSVKPAHAQGP